MSDGVVGPVVNGLGAGVAIMLFVGLVREVFGGVTLMGKDERNMAGAVRTVAYAMSLAVIVAAYLLSDRA